MSGTRIRPAAVCVYGNAAIIVALALYFFVAPVVILLFDFTDPALRGPGIPQCAWRWHRALTPKYARWARERMRSGRAESLGTDERLRHRVAAVRLGLLSSGHRGAAEGLGRASCRRRAEGVRARGD